MKTKLIIIMILMVSMLSGCTYIQKARRTDALEIENVNLRNRVAQLQKDNTKEVRQVYAEKDKELSSARALAVLHHLIGEGKIKPQRLSANGYGEFHPVALNDTVQNKQKNRRVEIVILPSKLSKVKPQ